jgi:pimeloyl-ACP methyl ester carboxylesterase/ketosteroid isomerase-like protein
MRLAAGVFALVLAFGSASGLGMEVPAPTGAAEKRNESALRRMVETVNAGDAAGYAQLYAADAVITIFGSESIKGRQAIEQYEAALMREFPGTRLAFYDVWHFAPSAVVRYGVNGRTTDGRSMGHEGLLFFRFDQRGAIVQERRYLDGLTPMAQLGAFGPSASRALPVLPGDLTSHAQLRSPTEKANRLTVRSMLTAIESGDAASFLSRTATDVIIDELMLPEPLSGRENAARWFETWRAAVRDLRLATTTSLAAGDDVLVETRMSGTLSGPIGRLGPAATPFTIHRSFLFELKGGAVTRLTSFLNARELAQATGQWPLRSGSAPAIRKGKTAGGIAYDVRGSGPVVVLLSGSNLDRRMWMREVDWLSKSHTVVEYDLRAHGESDTATTTFSHLGDLIGLLDELKIAKATLIGLSAGSAIALDAALEIPDRVDRIVLSGPAPSGYVPKTQAPFVGDMMAALKAGDYKKVSEVLLATSVFAAPPEHQALVRTMVTENDRMWTIDRALMKGPPQPAMGRLASVKAPALVLIGDKDELQREPAELLAAQIPGARIVRVPGGGHLLNLTSPKEFESAIASFLASK